MSSEHCVLLRMVTAKDAAMTRDVLARANLPARPCDDMGAMLVDLAEGAGTLVISEEMLAGTALAIVAEVLDRQAPWSDVPVVVLARNGANSPAIAKVMDRLPNVTVLECPVRVATLVTVVRSALKARARQYELRAFLMGLQLADQRKTEFLATLAHELRNPLAPITNTLELLAIEGADSALARRHAVIARHVRHMVCLVNDLMEMSRITRGMVHLQRSRFDLNELIDGAVEMSAPLIEGAHHELRIEKSGQALEVDGDAMRLTQVLANLLNNAAKYTLPGGTIIVRTARKPLHAVIEVIDNGAGLEGSMLESVFDMFVQVSGTARAAQGGLGIGLTLAKRLMDLHGGTVSASSPGLNQGSTFTMRLPLAPTSGASVSARPRNSLPHAKTPVPSLRVLVVDDNRDAADSLSELLDTIGVSASTAYHGEEALDMAERDDFDVVVLDIGMPGMDGCEVARRLRARQDRKQPTLVALTGWGQEAERSRIVAAGFDHHLLKPVDLPTLIEILALPGDLAVN